MEESPLIEASFEPNSISKIGATFELHRKTLRRYPFMARYHRFFNLVRSSLVCLAVQLMPSARKATFYCPSPTMEPPQLAFVASQSSIYNIHNRVSC